MKKMLTLVLILAVASFANAAQIWTISGSTAGQTGDPGWEVKPGDTLSMALSSNSSTAGGIDIDIITDNGATGAFTGASGHANLVNGIAGMSVASLNALLIANLLPPTSYAIDDWASVGLASGGTMVPINEAIFTLNYTVGAGLGLVTINGIADAGQVGWEQNLNQITLTEGNATVVPFSLNVVPEPATIALLCIGGLFLRRKK